MGKILIIISLILIIIGISIFVYSKKIKREESKSIVEVIESDNCPEGKKLSYPKCIAAPCPAICM